MMFKHFRPLMAEWQPRAATIVVAGVLAFLVACSSKPDRPQPADLGPNVPALGVRQSWSISLGGPVDFPLQVTLSDSGLFAASSTGQVVSLDPDTGRELWRAQVGAPISAGVGAQGDAAAVVTKANEVVLIRAGEVRWRHRLSTSSRTAPLVAGGRVFVLGADRSVVALDGASGRRLWQQGRPGEPLVLQQAGVILAVGDTLVVGSSGRLLGMNPLNGTLRWDAPVATPRGTNDVERLVDLVGRVSRVEDDLCVRAFQVAVGCVDAARGAVRWTRPAVGADGLHGDARAVFGTELDGRVTAWRRDNGEPLWRVDRLRWRQLTAPLLIGRSVAIGDSTGLVHLISRDDGAPMNRLSTDGSGIAGAPMQAGNTLIVATKAGRLFGFRPE
jgi:outer membrane assembly lipoprotein YfgL